MNASCKHSEAAPEIVTLSWTDERFAEGPGAPIEMTEEEKVDSVFAFAMQAAETSRSWEKGVYSLAQGLKGIPSLNSWGALRPIVEEWVEALVDDGLNREDDTSEIVLRFRKVYPEIREPFRFQKGREGMSEHLARAAANPPELAHQISQEFYGGSARASALLSVLMTLRAVATDGVFFLSCRLGARALGLDAATGGPARVAELLKLMVGDGVLEVERPGSRSHATSYRWRWPGASVHRVDAVHREDTGESSEESSVLRKSEADFEGARALPRSRQ